MRGLLVSFLVIGISAFSATSYESDIRKWHSEREERLRAPYGWLSIIGLHWVGDGKYSVGGAKENEVYLPGATCAKCAEIDLHDGQAFVTPTGQKRVPIDLDKQLEYERFKLSVIKRPSSFAIRVWDPESPTRKNFKGCQWFPVDEKLKIEATFEPAKDSKETIAIEDVTGAKSQESVAGRLKFTIQGVAHSLVAFPDDEGLFLVFRDQTSGKTSYGAGRFLSVEKRPKAGETVTLDFNRAYNPPCAFSKFTTCPLAPLPNHLKIAIAAGEKF